MADLAPASGDVLGHQQHQHQQQQVEENLEQDARFSCSICFDAATEPVVTQCGHLYCWPCLYRWLSPGMTPQERSFLSLPRLTGPVDASRRSCPVCKSEASTRTIVPIYVRNVNRAVVVGSGSNSNNHSNTNNSDNDNDRTPRSTSQQEPTPPQGSFSPLQHHQQQQQQDHHQQQQQPLQLQFSSLEDQGSSGASPPQIFRRNQEDDFENSRTEDMGLNIDGYDEEEDEHSAMDLGLDHNVPTTITTMIPSHLGVRQRRGGPGGVPRAESRDELSTTSTIVPTRPMPSRERANNNADANNNNNNNTPGHARDSSSSPPRNSAITIPGNAPTPNHHARATLSYGLVLSMHQTLLNATNGGGHGNTSANTNTNNSLGNNDDNSDSEYVPSLHFPTEMPLNRDSNNNSPNPNTENDLDLDSDPASTLFLSRLLFGLSLFVLICLLSF